MSVMPLPGGEADKAGNAYELLWTCDCLTKILGGQARRIRLEPVGAEGQGVEFWLEAEGRREYHQAKRQQAGKGHWTIADLASVLSSFKGHLDRDPEGTCVFVSTEAAAGLRELAERAAGAQSSDEFRREFLQAKNVADDFSRLKGQWACSDEEGWALLRRIRVETVGHTRLNDDVETMGEKNPAQAASFATQMQKAGLAAGPEEEKPEAATKSAPTPTPSPAPQPPKSEPAPQSEPSKPGQPQTPDITKKPEESAGKDTKSGDVVWRPGAPNSIPTIDKKTGKVVFVDGQTGKPVPGPVMVDKNSGTPVLAPDGKPYQTGGGRTEELLELSKKLAAQDPATMTPGQLEQWRRDMTNMREFLRLPNTDDEGWNRPRGPKEGERPQVPVGEPRQPPVEGAPLSEKTKAGEAFEALDKWFKDLKNSPPFSETPPLDPPPPSGPSPLPTGRSRPVPRLRPRRR